MLITKTNKVLLLQYYLAGIKNLNVVMRTTGLRPETIGFYWAEFALLEKAYPEKLKDFEFELQPGNACKPPQRYQELIASLPGSSRYLKAPNAARVGLFVRRH